MRKSTLDNWEESLHPKDDAAFIMRKTIERFDKLFQDEIYVKSLTTQQFNNSIIDSIRRFDVMRFCNNPFHFDRFIEVANSVPRVFYANFEHPVPSLGSEEDDTLISDIQDEKLKKIIFHPWTREHGYAHLRTDEIMFKISSGLLDIEKPWLHGRLGFPALFSSSDDFRKKLDLVASDQVVELVYPGHLAPNIFEFIKRGGNAYKMDVARLVYGDGTSTIILFKNPKSSDLLWSAIQKLGHRDIPSFDRNKSDVPFYSTSIEDMKENAKDGWSSSSDSDSGWSPTYTLHPKIKFPFNTIL